MGVSAHARRSTGVVWRRVIDARHGRCAPSPVMDGSLQITCRNFQHSLDLDALIRRRADELDDAAGHRLTSCHVVVELGHEHRGAARMFHVHIDMTMPEAVIAVDREPRDRHTHTDAKVAVRDAFDAAKRQVTEWEHKRYGHP